jgi:hypothetical protein
VGNCRAAALLGLAVASSSSSSAEGGGGAASAAVPEAIQNVQASIESGILSGEWMALPLASMKHPPSRSTSDISRTCTPPHLTSSSTLFPPVFLLPAGFQMACGAGPLCEEPLWGVAIEMEVRLAVRDGGTLELQEDVYGPFSGQVSQGRRGERARTREGLMTGVGEARRGEESRMPEVLAAL